MGAGVQAGLTCMKLQFWCGTEGGRFCRVRQLRNCRSGILKARGGVVFLARGEEGERAHVYLGEKLTVRAVERAEDGAATKYVFEGFGSRSRVATFEAASFLRAATTSERSRYSSDTKHDVCVSTAGGCTRSCAFCSVPTGDPPFQRLLSVEEIVAQVDYAVSDRNASGTMPNLVGLMGNGEPCDNPRLIEAIDALMSRPYSVDKICVSTIGENLESLNELATFAQRMKSHPTRLQLHFSLHSAIESTRRQLIPGKQSLDDIVMGLDRFAMSAFDVQRNPRPLRVNVTLMASDHVTNATRQDARAVAGFVLQKSRIGSDVPRVLKLSHFNPIPGLPFKAASDADRRAYVEELRVRGIPVFYEFKGNAIEVDANLRGGFACGQLRVTTLADIARGEAPKP